MSTQPCFPSLETRLLFTGACLLWLPSRLKTVGFMSVLDDQWYYQRSVVPFEETDNFVIKQHMDGSHWLPWHVYLAYQHLADVL